MGISKAFGLLARYQKVAAHIGQPGNLCIQQRHIDVLAVAAPCALVKGCENSGRRQHPRCQIHDSDAYLHGRTFNWAGDAHDATLGLNDEIVAWALPIGSRLAVARNAAVD